MTAVETITQLLLEIMEVTYKFLWLQKSWLTVFNNDNNNNNNNNNKRFL